MYKEVISQKQAVALITAFIIGSTSVLGIGGRAGQDVWISIILALLMASVIIPVYARILKLFPGQGLYEILDILFGKVLGKIITLLFVWYAFHLGALVIRNYTEFMTIISLTETPSCVLALLCSVLSIWAIREGIEVIGRWIAIFFPIMVFTLIILTILAIPILEYDNLKPVLYHGMKPVLDSAFSAFSFPFAETVLFIAVLDSLQKKTSPYKVYFLSLLIGGFFIFVFSIRTILILGPENASIQYFASYVSIRLIKIGDFLQRIESIVSITFILNGFTKGTICMYAAVRGTAKLFEIKDYHRIAAPLGILMALFSIIIYDSAMEMSDWAGKIYPYYAIPFQIVLPIIIWITAEIKSRLSNKNKDLSRTEISG
jgi:spore germination protein KB